MNFAKSWLRLKVLILYSAASCVHVRPSYVHLTTPPTHYDMLQIGKQNNLINYENIT